MAHSIQVPSTAGAFSPEGSEPLLVVRDLHVNLDTPRGVVAALRGVDLVLDRGETLGLIGESGSGKSLTASALMGLLPPTASVAGSIRVDGAEWLVLDEAALCRLRGDRVGMVFQEPMTALNPLHTIAAQVGEPLRLHRGASRAEARRAALALLEKVRLPRAAERLGAYPHQLSGGQRQRVGIALALACGPDLLIADEPTTALDVTIQREILALLHDRVRDDRMALLLISHDLGVMARVADRIAVMYGGTVVESGPTADVVAKLAHPYTRALFAARPRIGARAADGSKPRLANIPGRVPGLHEMPPGCPFAGRCAFVVDACRAALPPPVAVGTGHVARCIRVDEIGPPTLAAATA